MSEEARRVYVLRDHDPDLPVGELTITGSVARAIEAMPEDIRFVPGFVRNEDGTVTLTEISLCYVPTPRRTEPVGWRIASDQEKE